MAAQKENLLSLWHLTGKERNIFTTGGERSRTESRAMRLVQHLHELKERELAAQQHNRQLLQQFEEAQGTLRDMLTLTANMKTIRIEYERYLEESAPRWQQQLKEKTKAALRKRTEECCKSCIEKTNNPMTKSSADGPLFSQGPAPQEPYTQNSCLDYNQSGSPNLPHVQSSWLTLPQHQTAHGFPIRTSTEPQSSYHVPPSFPSHSFQLHYPISTPAYHHHHRAWPRQDPPVRPDHTRFWDGRISAGSEALWGPLHPEEPRSGMGEVQGVREEAEMSTTSSSEREVGGESRSRGFSQELDVKPVRLSSGSAEGSDSSRARGEKRKKREWGGRSRQSSSDKQTCSSQESPLNPSAIVNAAVTVAQSSESEASSQKSCSSRGRRRGPGLCVESPGTEKAVKESNGCNAGSQTEESESTAEESRSEEAGDQSPEVCGEETGSQREEGEADVSVKEAAGGEDVSSSSSGESSVAEKAEETREQEEDLGDGDDEVDKEDDGDKKEQSQRDEDEDSGSENTTDEEEEGSGIKNTTDKEEESEEEKPSGLKNEGAEDERRGSASSHDEEVDEDEDESGGESEDAEEQSGNEAGPQEESDSDDSIISPQIQSKTIQMIPEEAGEEEEDGEEEEEGSSTDSSDDDDSNESADEDIENLLAPKQQPQTQQENNVRTEDKPTVTCDKVEIFQAEPDKQTKTHHLSDSDEFDNFYD